MRYVWLVVGTRWLTELRPLHVQRPRFLVASIVPLRRITATPGVESPAWSAGEAQLGSPLETDPPLKTDPRSARWQACTSREADALQTRGVFGVDRLGALLMPLSLRRPLAPEDWTPRRTPNACSGRSTVSHQLHSSAPAGGGRAPGVRCGTSCAWLRRERPVSLRTASRSSMTSSASATFTVASVEAPATPSPPPPRPGRGGRQAVLGLRGCAAARGGTRSSIVGAAGRAIHALSALRACVRRDAAWPGAAADGAARPRRARAVRQAAARRRA